MFQGLKNKALAKRYNKTLISHENKFNPEISRGVETIGILTDDLEFDVTKNVKELASLFNIKEKNISVLFFAKNELGEKDFLYFTAKNLDWKGKLKSEAVNQFIYYPFDVLINYSKMNNPYLNMVVVSAKAKFKVGYESLDNRLYHFMLSLQINSETTFNKELVRYLKILKIL